uniref:Dolichyl-diphosphooligosaccharide--protein glycosyltransferase subunit KCP2 n=1 Tax=Caenorhabditis tropicalis TaxID=1561998 RepID=A0A1I7T8Y8_9PELO
MSSSYLPLVSLAQKIGSVAFVASIVFGAILIFLTLFGVRQIFGTYKYLMIIFTFLGIFLAALETILHLNLHFYNNGLVFFTLSTPFDLNKDAVRLLLRE